MSHPPADLTGRRYQRWLVLSYVEGSTKPPRWLCRCDCGAVKVVSGPSLKGGSRSCGCLQKEEVAQRNLERATHGMSQSPEYRIWASMWDRCTNPRARGFSEYSSRVPPESWRSFETFLTDMGPRPEGMTLERIDNSKGYGPGNCRWATQAEQSVNKSTTRLITFRGETKALATWCKELGINYSTAAVRLHRGKSVEEALK